MEEGAEADRGVEDVVVVADHRFDFTGEFEAEFERADFRGLRGSVDVIGKKIGVVPGPETSPAPKPKIVKPSTRKFCSRKPSAPPMLKFAVPLMLKSGEAQGFSGSSAPPMLTLT